MMAGWRLGYIFYDRTWELYRKFKKPGTSSRTRRMIGPPKVFAKIESGAQAQ
jgi:hypothetical protein